MPEAAAKGRHSSFSATTSTRPSPLSCLPTGRRPQAARLRYSSPSGLNAIKKERTPKVEKDLFGKMFGMMLPSGSKKLRLSKMNMAGLGSRMMRHIMKKKNVESLESLRDEAVRNGVEFIACQMSMDVMGVSREELLDNVTVGGVATYMNRADGANVNLFI